MAETPNYEEVRKLYRVLSLLQANITAHLMRVDDPNEKEQRAVKIKAKLIPIALEYDNPPCKAGQVRDPTTGKCESV